MRNKIEVYSYLFFNHSFLLHSVPEKKSTMNESAVIKIQAIWRGALVRKYVLYMCPLCHGSTLGPLSGGGNVVIMVCERCYYGANESKTPEKVDSLFEPHFCGDWMCPGDCGVLWCGCIDVCRKRHGCHDLGGW